MASKCPQMSTIKLLVHKCLTSLCFEHGQVGRCDTAYVNGLVGYFLKK